MYLDLGDEVRGVGGGAAAVVGIDVLGQHTGV